MKLNRKDEIRYYLTKKYQIKYHKLNLIDILSSDNDKIKNK